MDLMDLGGQTAELMGHIRDQTPSDVEPHVFESVLVVRWRRGGKAVTSVRAQTESSERTVELLAAARKHVKATS